MDAAGFRVYFGDGASRVEWTGVTKFSAHVAVAPSGASAAGSGSPSDILTVRRIADETARARGFWDWERTATGEFVRKVLTIDVHDGQNIARWNFENAWPKKYTGATLQAGGNEVAIETLELAHEGLSIR